jgi:hypothetical protein
VKSEEGLNRHPHLPVIGRSAPMLNVSYKSVGGLLAAFATDEEGLKGGRFFVGVVLDAERNNKFCSSSKVGSNSACCFCEVNVQNYKGLIKLLNIYIYKFLYLLISTRKIYNSSRGKAPF